jgi:hypothetical protein
VDNLTALSVTETGLLNDNEQHWQHYGRKWTWLNLIYCPNISMERLRKNKKNLWTVGVTAEIRTLYIQNTDML